MSKRTEHESATAEIIFDTEEQPWNSCRTKTLFRLKYESLEIQLMFGRRMITVTVERDSNVVMKRREFYARLNENACAPITTENFKPH